MEETWKRGKHLSGHPMIHNGEYEVIEAEIIETSELINKELKKNSTDFIPVDSEHFSLWYGIQNLDINNIEKIFLTASGGPFNNLPLNKFKNITITQALKHPNWKMGKKISIDSATMINKIYEVIEAKNIFNLSYNQISILIHPNSYIHAIIEFQFMILVRYLAV